MFGLANIISRIFSVFGNKFILAGLYVFGQFILPLIKRVLYTAGLTIVTVSGLNFIYDQLRDLLIEKLGDLPADVLAILGMMNIDIAFTMILSAATIKKLLDGWSDLSSRRQTVWKEPRLGYGETQGPSREF